MAPQREADRINRNQDAPETADTSVDVTVDAATEACASQQDGDQDASAGAPAKALCQRDDTGFAPAEAASNVGETCQVHSETSPSEPLQADGIGVEAPGPSVSAAEASNLEAGRGGAGKVEAGQVEFDNWAMARFRDDAPDGVRMVRVNTSMIARRGKSAFAVRLGLAIPGCSWSPEVAGEGTSDLDTVEGLELEGAIHTFLRQEQAGVLPIIVCEADTREFIVYLNTTEQGEALVERLAQENPDLDLHYYLARDPEWEAFWGLADSLGLLEASADLGHTQIATC